MSTPLRQITSYAWVAQSTVYDTNSGIFLVGRDAFLVDPGVTQEELDAAAAFLTARRASVRLIILTHAHWDHLLGPERFPQATVVAHDRYLDVLKVHREDLCRQVMTWDTEARTMPFVPPKPQLTFNQRLSLHLGGLELQLLYAPGHAPDHCVLYESGAGLLWAGDMLSDLEVPMPMDSFAHYLRTLEALSAKRVEILVPGHGTPTTDSDDIGRRIAQDRDYLRAVWQCVTRAVSGGAGLKTTVETCGDITFFQPDAYPNAHVWNVEQAYLEAGGQNVPDRPVGWAQDWL